MVRFSLSFILIWTHINHLLGFLNNRCTNTTLSEQNLKFFASMNSAFIAANPWDDRFVGFLLYKQIQVV